MSDSNGKIVSRSMAEYVLNHGGWDGLGDIDAAGRAWRKEAAGTLLLDIAAIVDAYLLVEWNNGIKAGGVRRDDPRSLSARKGGAVEAPAVRAIRPEQGSLLDLRRYCVRLVVHSLIPIEEVVRSLHAAWVRLHPEEVAERHVDSDPEKFYQGVLREAKKVKAS